MNVLGNRTLSSVYSRLVLRFPRVQLALTSLAAPDQEVDIELFGAPLRINKRRELGLWRLFKALKGTHWQTASARLLTIALIMDPEDTFVDIGANVGFYASIISKINYLYPRARTYAIEAHPDTTKRLRESVRGRRVEVLDVALSNRPGKLEFVEGPNSFVFSMRGHASDYQLAGRTQVVDAARLDGLGIEGDSIIMKISVRGYEHEAVEGAAGLFDANRVKAVVLDSYDQQLAHYLEGRGFKLFDGLTMEPRLGSSSLLAVHSRYLP